MSFRFDKRARLVVSGIAVLAVALSLGFAYAGRAVPSAQAAKLNSPFCTGHADLCTETREPWGYNGQYTGHDEPSVLFYSNTQGAGNSNLYRMTLPTDPPTLPNQSGTGGTFNFQLHPAFWFGMAMCDNQSAPNPGNSATIACTPDSDANIYDGTNPTAPDYIGKHPGVAFMEMQFYPPAWTKWPAGVSCDPTKWCAALNIDSLNENQNTGALNNAACLNSVGLEPVNFAFITRNGVAQAPANPVDATLATFTPSPSADLMMESGDTITVDMHDTAAGFQVVIHDQTSGQSGLMTASVSNGFGHVVFDPNATTCSVEHSAFHPAYGSSSEHTRVPWAAHSYNVAYSDEIGHFEYCSSITGETGNCTSAGATDPSAVDSDDAYCFAPPFKAPFESARVQIGGCISSDEDFDGPEYANNWPGTLSNASQDAALHSTPIVFTSPLFNGSQNYDRVAFETDLPRIEVPGLSPNNSCNRSTGAGCVDPPNGASFYPIYTTGTSGGQCVWQEGGAFIPGTTNTFGGTSKAEYGPLLFLTYPAVGGASTRTNDFRNVLSNNPCQA